MFLPVPPGLLPFPLPSFHSSGRTACRLCALETQLVSRSTPPAALQFLNRAMGDSQERIRRALDKMLYLPHLQAQHADPSLPTAAPAGAGGSSRNGSAGVGRPWDRGDLFRRLATFKSGTWFCKPQSISPVECARRGWTNTAPDLLTCEVRGRSLCHCGLA